MCCAVLCCAVTRVVCQIKQAPALRTYAKEVHAICQEYSQRYQGKLAFSYTTGNTGVCKPKHARLHRYITIMPAMAAMAQMQVMAAQQQMVSQFVASGGQQPMMYNPQQAPGQPMMYNPQMAQPAPAQAQPYAQPQGFAPASYQMGQPVGQQMSAAPAYAAAPSSAYPEVHMAAAAAAAPAVTKEVFMAKCPEVRIGGGGGGGVRRWCTGGLLKNTSSG